MLTSLYVEIFYCSVEYRQRVAIRFLLQEDTHADDIHRRLQAPFTDDVYGIRSVRGWCQFVRQEREDLHDDLTPVRSLIGFIDIKILSVLERGPFHSLCSLAEVIGISYSIVIGHLRDSLGTKNLPFLRGARRVGSGSPPSQI
jgi:hypothetical protein